MTGVLLTGNFDSTEEDGASAEVSEELLSSREEDDSGSGSSVPIPNALSSSNTPR